MGSLSESEAWPTSNTFLIGLRVSTSAYSLLSMPGGGCPYYAKCKTVLHEIDSEMNIRYCGYSAKWRWCNWCSMVDGNGGCHDLCHCLPKISLEHCRHKKQHQRWPGNSKSQSKFRNYRSVLLNWYLRSRMMLEQHTVDVKTSPATTR